MSDTDIEDSLGPDNIEEDGELPMALKSICGSSALSFDPHPHYLTSVSAP